jgi:outer membrane protein
MENGERLFMNWLAATILVLFTAPLFGQTAVPVIAVIDVQKVVSNSEVGKKALADIKVIKDKKQQEINTKQAAIQSLQDKLEKEKDVLSPEAQEKRREEVQKLVTDLRRFQEDSQNEIQGRLEAALKNMEQRVLPIIQKMGNEKGYSIIVSRDQLIYYNAKNDVTDEVIRLFNEQSGSAQTQPKKP